MLYNSLNLQSYPLHVTFLSMDIDALIGQNLKRIRLSKKLSQDHLAELVQIPKSLISGAENNKRGIGKDILSRLCKALNVQPYEFYLDEKTPLPISDLERKAIYAVREAEHSGVGYIAEETCTYLSHRVNTIKKQKKAGPHKGRAARLKAGSG